MNRKQKYYKFILYLVVLILINIVGRSVFFRIDLTANNLYSLSDASIKAVSTLKEPLTVNVFFTKNLPAPYNNVERYLQDLLAEYEANSNSHMSYRFYNVSAEEEGLGSAEVEKNRKSAQDYGIYPANVQAVDKDQIKMQRAYMGMVLIHGDVMEKIPVIDSTEGLEYKITSAIQKMNNKISALVSLPQKIKIYLVSSSSLAQIAPIIKLQGLEGLKPGLQGIVDRLNSRSYGQLQFLTIDPAMGEGTPDQLRRYEKYGLQWPQFTTPAGGIVQPGKGTLALGLEYGEKSIEQGLLTRKLALTERGPEEQYAVVDLKEIEGFIEANIDSIININEDVGYLTSHGALALQAAPQMRMQQQQSELSAFNELLSNSYSVKQVNLQDNYIPESIDTLIIAGPKENFTDWQLFLIDQFLMKGKSLALFLDAFNEIQPQNQQQFQQPVYLPINTGLEKLLNHYGLSVKKSYVLDENCYVNRDRESNEMPIYFVPLIGNDKINHDVSFLENLKQLVVIKASPLEADKDKIKNAGLKLTELISSSDKSWEMSGRINLLPYMIQPPKETKEMQSKPLVYILEGQFNSYFADKPLPTQPDQKDIKKETELPSKFMAGEDDKDKKKEEDKAKESPKPVIKETRVKEEKGILSKGKPGKIFLLGTSEMLKDSVLQQQRGYANPNSDFIINAIDYLNNREDIAVMRSKVQRFNPLKKDISPFARVFAKIFNIWGLPVLLILMGMFIWGRRTARKKQIQAMFKK
ncbi:MAG: GldG family protein [Acidobacteria bacterium]|jgi:ABC-type uncharacterized transport system involved in gliding motility auxiliary subunit|nr:GldG family protein [Acidobacteriota bacterium]